MPPQQTLNEKVEEYRRDLDAVEGLLEQLKREYDLYFAGAHKRPPFEMRTQVERLLRKWRSSSIQKLELTYRLNTLSSKYNSMVEVWEKILRRREIDPKALSPYGPTHAEVVAATLGKVAEPPAAQAARPPAAAAAAPPPADLETRLRRVFNQYVDAKKDLGETVDSLTFAKFREQLETQIERIREKTKCKDVEFGVVRKDGKVSLTAKPVKAK